MTGKSLKELFANIKDDDVIHFVIDDNTLDLLYDAYRYSTSISSTDKMNDGTFEVSINAEYTR